jgi:hypothetical protein
VALLLENGSFSDVRQAGTNRFELRAPAIMVSVRSRAELDRAEVLARVPPGTRGQLALLVVTRLKPQSDPRVTRMPVAELRRSASVLALECFPDPPRPSDFADDAVDDHARDLIRWCGLPERVIEIETNGSWYP